MHRRESHSSSGAAIIRKHPFWRPWRERQSAPFLFQREIWIVKRIRIEDFAPLIAHDPEFLSKHLRSLARSVMTDRLGLEMIVFDLGGPENAPALRTQPNAEVDVVESNRQALIKSTEVFKDRAPHGDTRGGDAGQVLLQAGRARNRR